MTTARERGSMTQADAAHSAPAGPECTRERLISMISVDGPIAAGDLAERLGLTGAAVRRHLGQLEAEGIIQEREPAPAKRGRGRPRREFVLSATLPVDADSSETDDLALAAMNELRAAGGKQAVIRLAEARTAQWEAEFEKRLAAAEENGRAATPSERLEIIAELLQERGYAASVRPVTVQIPNTDRELHTIQLCQGRCPVQEIAAEFPELCDVETSALARMLGVPVQRLATRASGAHVCTTHVTPMPAVSGRATDQELFTEGRTP